MVPRSGRRKAIPDRPGVFLLPSAWPEAARCPRIDMKELCRMAKGIRFHETGGPEVLRGESTDVGEPGFGEVRIRHVAVGLNFSDTYFRTGLYPPPLPHGIGVPAAGGVPAPRPRVLDLAQ